MVNHGRRRGTVAINEVLHRGGNDQRNNKNSQFSNVKDLLATGFLDGVPVTYVSKKYQVELNGFIEDGGYQCGCSVCNYTQVLPATEFRRHAGAPPTSFPNDHIILDNGVSLDELVKNLVNVPLDSLNRELKRLTGCRKEMYPNTNRDFPPDLLSQLRSGSINDVPRACRSLKPKKRKHYKVRNQQRRSPADLISLLPQKQSFQNKGLRSSALKVPARSLTPWRTLPAVTSSEVPTEPKDVHGNCSIDGSEPVRIQSSPLKNQCVTAGLVKLSDDLRGSEGRQAENISTTDAHCDRFEDEVLESSVLLAAPCPSNPISIVQGCVQVETKEAEIVIPVYQAKSFGFPAETCPFVSVSGVHVSFHAETAEAEASDCSLVKSSSLPAEFCAQTLCNTASSGESSKQASLLQGKEPCHPAVNRTNKVQASRRLDVKLFLSTGVLEGRRVTYKFKKGKVELQGIIKDCGYLCGCTSCNYSKTLCALEFEKHAGASTKNQNHHIVLENGLSLYNLVKELKLVTIDSLNEVLQTKIGHPANSKCYDLWKELFQKLNEEVQVTSSSQDNTSVQQEYCDNLPNTSCFPDPLEEAGCGSPSIVNMETIPPGPASGEKCGDASAAAHNSLIILNNVAMERHVEATESIQLSLDKPYLQLAVVNSHQQKRGTQDSFKKRDHYLHDLLFRENGLPYGTSLAYLVGGKPKLTGYKSDDGIVCDCCNAEISPSMFEVHAGFGSRRRPYENIYPVGGLYSLHQLSLMLAKGERFSVVYNEDWCRICSGEGHLIACDSCTRSFHSSCLQISIPLGKWCCFYCKNSQAKSITALVAAANKRMRVRRVLKKASGDSGCCVLCKGKNFSTGEFNPQTIILCYQCEKEYHAGCHEKLQCLKTWPGETWFCSAHCINVYEILRKFASEGGMMLPEREASILSRKAVEKGFPDESKRNLHWEILSGHSEPLKFDLMSEAIEVIKDGFYSILVEQHDLIPAMVYSKECAGQVFEGFYTTLLTVNSVVVSVGMLRIFGKDIAELPLVVTRESERGKGYFLTLLALVENLLKSLEIENLVLPTEDNLIPMWTNKLGFLKVADEKLRNYMDEVPLLMFENTTILEKNLYSAPCIQ